MTDCPLEDKQAWVTKLHEASAPMRQELCVCCCAEVLLCLVAALLVDNFGVKARDDELPYVARILRSLVDARLAHGSEPPPGETLQ